ncbi:MAG: hypothetical protein JAY67_20910 [Candidatus Thiodiazotropha taylori]|nr:hypothetical protein [Candidatus Thiodiazotropha taylori]
MIHVDRILETQAISDALNKPFTKYAGMTELERAREYYNLHPPPEKAFKFVRYKEWDVCRVLDMMFHGKCAYCESSYRAVDSRDVEHFRPKGKVKEAPSGNLGYWWLAAKWTNLLPSCPPCNQRRKQIRFESGMTLEELEQVLQKKPKESSGKTSSFPLADMNWVTSEEQSLDAEDPLLINPCDQEPADFLDWVFDWDQKMKLWDADPVYPFVIPKRDDLGRPDPHGETSIAIYGLNRSGLFRERMEHVQDINLQCQTIVDVLMDLGENNLTLARKNKLTERLAKYKQKLYGYCQPEKKFSGMATEFVKLFESKLLEI